MLVRVRNAAVPQCSYAIRAAFAQGCSIGVRRAAVLAALTITDDRRVDAGAADVRVGDVKCAMTITNDR